MLGLEEKKKPAFKKILKRLGFRIPNLERPAFLPLRFFLPILEQIFSFSAASYQNAKKTHRLWNTEYRRIFLIYIPKIVLVYLRI